MIRIINLLDKQTIHSTPANWLNCMLSWLNSPKFSLWDQISLSSLTDCASTRRQMIRVKRRQRSAWDMEEALTSNTYLGSWKIVWMMILKFRFKWKSKWVSRVGWEQWIGKMEMSWNNRRETDKFHHCHSVCLSGLCYLCPFTFTLSYILSYSFYLFSMLGQVIGCMKAETAETLQD